MNKMLVTVFADEAGAFAGTQALRRLESEGSLALYAMGVIAKDAQGQVSVKESTGTGPIGTGVGLAVGSLIGLLGGPVGLAVGAVAGTLAGALRDYWVAGVGLDFIEETEKFLLPGKVAVIAEVEEEWTLPVDTAMEAAGGVVFRRARDDLAQAQATQDIAMFKAEVAELQAEYTQAMGTAQSRIQAKLDAAHARLENTFARARSMADAMEREASARIHLLEAGLATAQGDIQHRLQNRVERVRASHAERSAQLAQARQPAKDAPGH